MILLLILILSEFLTFLAFRQHYKGFSKTRYYLSAVINAILSIYLWLLYIEVSSFSGLYDEPAHVWLLMNLNGAFTAVLMPRVLFNLLHYSGKVIRYRKGTHIRALTNIGIVTWILIFTVVVSESIIGKFNFTTERVAVKVRGLNKDLEGLTIVQISDLHLSTFYRQKGDLKKVMDLINSYNPDLIFNTGDFVEFGYREFDNNDTILSLAKARYGSFAILGNHDIGTYYPGYNAVEIDTNIARISRLITKSGYTLLKDENAVINVNGSKIGIAGIVTRGRFPHIIHGDLHRAIAGLDSVDYTILLSHDPNQWEAEVRGKTNVDLTLSGHTHGMQMGIVTSKFKWSPSEYFYPHWNGLYSSGNQFQYVNRGLGVIEIPFRILMPPEITIIKLERASE